ncbi:MAB_1171c family putative transporter [Streptomyces californicus]|uniref:MAB_1171c family putative transporter n=1 Tax=Streptomyces californicus TaxID=67351 RepID=UPI0037F68DBA
MASLNVWYQSAGTIVLWLAVLMRAPYVSRSPQQRGLWLAVAMAVIAMTLNLPSVRGLTTELLGEGHVVGLVRSIFGVISAAAVLYFVAETTNRTHLRQWYQGGVCALLIALVVIDMIEDQPHGYVVSGARDSPLLISYWLLLTAAHLVTNALCIHMCWRYARKGASYSLVWSLRLFGVGTAFAGLYWVGQLALLFSPAAWITALQPYCMEAHGLFRAGALLVPVARAARCISVDIFIVWRLWPLWRELTAAVPGVTLTKSRPRLLEILWPPVPWNMFAYCKVIETRDAILVLRGHVGPALLEEARAFVSGLTIADGQRDAAVLAYSMHGACRSKPVKSCSAASAVPVSPPRSNQGDFLSEVQFLLEVTRVYGLVARSYTGRPEASRAVGSGPAETFTPGGGGGGGRRTVA